VNERLQRYLRPVPAVELPGLPRAILVGTRVLGGVLVVMGPLVCLLHAAVGDWLIDRVLVMTLVEQPLLWACLGLTFTAFGKRNPELALFLLATIVNGYIGLAGLQSPTGENPYSVMVLMSPVTLAAFAPWRPSLSFGAGGGGRVCGALGAPRRRRGISRARSSFPKARCCRRRSCWRSAPPARCWARPRGRCSA
jgi:hypothetical protein